MSITTEVHESLAAEEAEFVAEIIPDVHEAAEEAVALGCGDDNPYK